MSHVNASKQSERESHGFTAEEFRKDGFLKATGFKDASELVDEDGDLSLTISFGSRKANAKQHAHLRILIKEDGSGTATINYHKAERAVKGEQSPYLEDSAQWFGQFFKSETPHAHINSVFIFDKRFVPTINLPYPLLSSDEALKDSVVTGVAITFPETAPLATAIVDRGEESTFIFGQAYLDVDLKQFELIQEVERFSQYINPLIRRENGNGSKSTTGV
ncbi:MAG: hypothetical protein LC795_19290 [Acidobacteria bacterium]|nr:hypothetical protein [Acidobacteriota bacterium]